MRIPLILSLCVVAATASAEPPRMWPGDRPATTQGIAVIDASSADVYAAATDYAHWRSLFSDVESVQLLRGGERDAVVKMRSRALEHEVTIQFDNEPGRVVRFHLIGGPPGARARGEYVLEPDGMRTIMRATLYVDVVGPPSWFVSDAHVTRMREAKLRADLGDLMKWAAARPR